MKQNRTNELFGVTIRPRVKIQPKSSVSVATPAARKDVMQSVQKVMSVHHDVLVALKNR